LELESVKNKSISYHHEIPNLISICNTARVETTKMFDKFDYEFMNKI